LADILENDHKISTSCNGYPVVKFIQWNSLLSAAEHPHYDVIIHKLTEDIGIGDEVKDNDDTVMNNKILDIELYLKIHPSTVIVDPVNAVRKVTSRARTCSTLASIQANSGDKNCPFNQPKFILLYEKSSLTSSVDVLSELKKENIDFPVICKPIVACGTTNSHSMVVIVSSKDIALVDNYRPCIVQQYFNHDATLFKVYVLDEDVMIYRRKSLPNLYLHDGEPTNGHHRLRSVAFDSRYSYPTLQDFQEAIGDGKAVAATADDSKDRSSCTEGTHFSSIWQQSESWKLSRFLRGSHRTASKSEPEEDRLCNQSAVAEGSSDPPLDLCDVPRDFAEVCSKAAGAIREEFGLSLFGFDVIVPVPESAPTICRTSQCNPHSEGPAEKSNSTKPVVIDVNYFPSYKEVSDFPARLRAFLLKRALTAAC